MIHERFLIFKPLFSLMMLSYGHDATYKLPLQTQPVRTFVCQFSRIFYHVFLPWPPSNNTGYKYIKWYDYIDDWRVKAKKRFRKNFIAVLRHQAMIWDKKWPDRSTSTCSLSLITLLSSRVRFVAHSIHPTYSQLVEIARLSLWPYANHSLNSTRWDLGVDLPTLRCPA